MAALREGICEDPLQAVLAKDESSPSTVVRARTISHRKLEHYRELCMPHLLTCLRPSRFKVVHERAVR